MTETAYDQKRETSLRARSASPRTSFPSPHLRARGRAPSLLSSRKQAELGSGRKDGTSAIAVRPRVASDVAVGAFRPSPGGGVASRRRLGFGSASREARSVHRAGSPASGPRRDPRAGGNVREHLEHGLGRPPGGRARPPRRSRRRDAPAARVCQPYFRGVFSSSHRRFVIRGAPPSRARRAFRPDTAVPDPPSCLPFVCSSNNSLSRSTRSRISSSRRAARMRRA